jgi:hypothetical protein
MLVHDLPLPRIEDDWTQMLPPSTVLREDLDPPSRCHLDDHSIVRRSRADANACVGQHQLRRGRALVDDGRICAVEDDPQLIGPAGARDAAVAEIKPSSQL